MAKNKEVFEYQAKVSLDLGEASKKLKQVKEGVMSLGGDLRLPKHFITDLSEAQNKLEEMQRNAPGSGHSEKDIKKYASEMQKLVGKISLVSDELKGVSFSDDKLRKSFNDLAELVRMLEEAKSFGESDFNIRKSKISAAPSTKGYKQGLEKARTAALEAAELGYKGGTPKSFFREISQQIKNEKVTAKEKGNDDRVKELALTEEKIALLEKEIGALRTLQENRLKRQASLTEQLETKTNERRTEVEKKFGEAISPLSGTTEDLKGTVNLTYSQAEAQKEVEESARAFDTASQKIKNLFSATTVFYTLRRIVQGVIRDFQELDTQFNEIAIVSEYSTQEMWKTFGKVNATAQEFGVTTKNVLEVQNLYYHQGKDIAEVNKLTAQTLTLAKITGMDYAKATSNLTAVLNAYNIAAEDAVLVTDSIAAMDTNAAISSEELTVALTKTASIAANAGMSLQSTEIFLTKMIETTREAPENLGTALKTIIARFGEVKQEIDGQEIELADVNRVDTALKSIGISLLDTAGQIRDLDDVFMELSAKWDDLDRNTQRYIATMAAGSRQQSRFIAMMEDYDRTLELTNIMQSSAGISARQLEKSMESLESSLNRLESTWQEFYSEVIYASWFKNAIDGINALLKALNSLPGPIGQITAALGLYAVKTQIVDRVSARLAVSYDVLRGKITEEAAAQAYKDKLEAKRKGHLLSRIKSHLTETAAIKSKTKAMAEQAIAQKTVENSDPVFSKDEVIKMLTEQGMVKELAEEYYKLALAKETADMAGDGSIHLDSLNKVDINELFKGKLNFDVESPKGFKENFKASKLNTKQALKGGLTNTTKEGGKLAKAFETASSSAGSLLGSVTAILPYIAAAAVIIAAIAATIYICYKSWAKNNEVVTDNTKHLEELSEQTEKYNKQLEKTRSLLDLSKEYKELQELSVKSADEIERENELAKEIAQEYPNLLDYIDEEGNYRLKNIQYLDEEIAKQKELTLAMGATNAELQKNLALKGINLTDDTQVEAIETRLQGIVQEKGWTDKTTKAQAGKIAQLITGQSGYGTHQGNELIQGFLDGKKTSLSMGDLNEIFGTTDLFTEENIAAFFEAAKGKDLSNRDDLETALNAIGSNIYEVDASRFYKYLDYIPEIGTFITEQWGKVETSSKTALTNALSLEDFDFEMSAQDMAKIGEIFSTAETDKVVDFFSNMGAEEYQSFVDDYFNLDNKKLSDLKAKSTEGLSDIEKIAAEYYNKQKVILEKKANELKDHITDDDIIGNLTSEQVKAMSKQFSTLASKTNEMYAGMVFDDLFKIGEEEFGKNTEKFNDYINIINSADLSSPEGVEAFQKKLYELGYSTDEVYRITLQLAGGIKNLPLKSSADQIDNINKKLEETQKIASSIANLFKGEGTFEDINALAKEMANNGATAAEIMSLYQSLTSTINGFKVSQGVLADYTEKYLAAQKKIVTSSIQEYMTKKKSLELERDSLDSQKDTQKIAELNAQIEEYDAQIQVEKIGYYALQIEYKKALIEAQTELLELEVAAAKNLADSLMGLDRFKNLNEILNRLEGLDDIYTFEIEFSTNPDVIADGYKDLINNTNQQLAVNLAGQDAAQDEMANWADFISKNSLNEYITLEDNVAYVDQNKIADLYQKRYEAEMAVANGTGTKHEVEKLDYQINMIEKSAEGYNKASQAYTDYTKKAQQNADKLIKINEEVLKAQSDGMELFKEVVIEAEDAQLEAVKKKYDAMKEEDQKYLDSVRKMVDKEREIRDRDNSIKDIKDKEKKLAMMKMDTSGVYAKEIRELEGELDQAYQDFEDSEVDRAISQMEEEFNARAEIWDKETAYMEGVFEGRRVTNEYYWELYQETAKGGTQAVVDFMTQKSTEYQSKDQANQELTRQEWTKTIASAQAAGILIQTSQDEVVIPAMDRARDSAGGVEGAIQGYANKVTTTKGGIVNTIDAISQRYGTLATKVTGVANAYQLVLDKFDKLIPQAKELLGIMQGLDDIEIPEINDPVLSYTGQTRNMVTGKITYVKNEDGTITETIDKSKTTAYYQYQDAQGQTYWSTKNSKGGLLSSDSSLKSEKDIQSTVTQMDFAPDGTHVGIGDLFWQFSNKQIEEDSIEVGTKKYVLSPYYNEGTGHENHYICMDDLTYDSYNSVWTLGKLRAPYYTFQYAKGGYVDYTGPAWVDGTKSHPEYMLNATQTAQFESLVDALSMVYKTPKLSNQPTANSQKTGDSHMEFHINIEGGISSDYDVDRAVEKIEKKILDSGKYRNTTVIKKSN